MLSRTVVQSCNPLFHSREHLARRDPPRGSSWPPRGQTNGRRGADLRATVTSPSCPATTRTRWPDPVTPGVTRRAEGGGGVLSAASVPDRWPLPGLEDRRRSLARVSNAGQGKPNAAHWPCRPIPAPVVDCAQDSTGRRRRGTLGAGRAGDGRGLHESSRRADRCHTGGQPPVSAPSTRNGKNRVLGFASPTPPFSSVQAGSIP